MSTSALEMSIQAVSPLFGMGAAAAAAGAAAAASFVGVCAYTAPASNKQPMRPMPALASKVLRIERSLIFELLVLFQMRLKGIHIAFAGADADGLLEGADEDFAVADLARAGGSGDRFDRAVDEIARHREFDLQLWQEAHRT